MSTSHNYSGFVDGPTIRLYVGPHHGISWPNALNIWFFGGPRIPPVTSWTARMGESGRTIDDAYGVFSNVKVARALRARKSSSVETKRDMSCYIGNYVAISQWSEG